MYLHNGYCLAKFTIGSEYQQHTNDHIPEAAAENRMGQVSHFHIRDDARTNQEGIQTISSFAKHLPFGKYIFGNNNGPSREQPVQGQD